MNHEQKITNNIQAPNNEKAILHQHFPQCFDKEGNFLLEKFAQQLTEKAVNFSTESYGLDWLGKSYARLLANDPATTLLKADEQHNQQTPHQQANNLLIKGDNLEVLKHLANAYHEKVKMIYIDPPYNTGSDGFVYQDDRKFTTRELQQAAGISEEKAKRILAFTQSNSNSHSAWLTFMYPRLYIAKQLLKDDGVIFVSIDDNEVAQLRLLMDEIFGEENFVSEFVWINNPAGRQIQGIGAATTKEYMLSYAKNTHQLKEFQIDINLAKELMPSTYKGFNFDVKEDDKGEYIITHELNNGNFVFNEITRPNLVFDIFYNPATTTILFGELNSETPKDFVRISPKTISNYTAKYYAWRWSKDKILADKSDLAFVENNGKWSIFTKRRDFRKTVLKDTFTNLSTITGSKDLEKFNLEKTFDYPKPVNLIKILILAITSPTDLILDFFAGSGTTGDAVMQLNAEDGGQRQYILVQLPEAIEEKKNKAAYDFVTKTLKAEPTIFAITKERLMRAAQKINAQLDEKNEQVAKQIKQLQAEINTDNTQKAIAALEQQIKNQTERQTQNGFKIYETMPIWDDYDFEAETFEASQTLFDPGKLTETDLQALLTTWKTNDNIALTQELQTVRLPFVSEQKPQEESYTAYYANNKLYLMHKGFKTEHLVGLIEKIDADHDFNPTTIIAFAYHFESKHLRELSENLQHYSYRNHKSIDVTFIKRY